MQLNLGNGLLLLCAVLLQACTTHYQANSTMGGFTEVQVDTNVYEVTFGGRVFYEKHGVGKK